MHLNLDSGQWHPDLSHQQRHLNIAIAYNIIQYLRFTGDADFLERKCSSSCAGSGSYSCVLGRRVAALETPLRENRNTSDPRALISDVLICGAGGQGLIRHRSMGSLGRIVPSPASRHSTSLLLRISSGRCCSAAGGHPLVRPIRGKDKWHGSEGDHPADRRWAGVPEELGHGISE